MKRALYLFMITQFLIIISITAGCKEDSETGPETDVGSDTNTDTAAGTETETETGTETDTVADTDTGGSICDGDDKDCYADCWECALEKVPTCAEKVQDCLTDGDTDGDGCNGFYSCKQDNCCDTEGCLKDTEWEECIGNCKTTLATTFAAVDKYDAIDKCVACDACSLSCGKKQAVDFAMCTPSNDTDHRCFETETGDSTPCFSWAGWGGPCTRWTTACKDNADCVILEECINATWDFSNYQTLQVACFDAASDEVELLYWDYMQCIFCQACDVACIAYKDSKKCELYTPLYTE